MTVRSGFSRWLRRVAGGPRLRIVLRQSPDWRNTPHATLLEGSRAFCRTVGRAAGIGENFISDVVAVWDRTFRASFFEVRARMKDIAQMNLSAVPAIRSPVAAVTAPADAAELYVFIDDDDWLRPDLLQALRSCGGTDADGIVFGNILCVSRVELRPLDDVCYTNNYAVSGDFLLRHPADFAPLVQHWDAHAIFHRRDFRRVQAPVYLSATNKHPASTMKLKDGLEHAELSGATLRRLVQRYVDESATAVLPPEAEWVAPHVRQVREVFAGLR